MEQLQEESSEREDGLTEERMPGEKAQRKEVMTALLDTERHHQRPKDTTENENRRKEGVRSLAKRISSQRMRHPGSVRCPRSLREDEEEQA